MFLYRVHLSSAFLCEDDTDLESVSPNIDDIAMRPFTLAFEVERHSRGTDSQVFDSQAVEKGRQMRIDDRQLSGPCVRSQAKQAGEQ